MEQQTIIIIITFILVNRWNKYLKFKETQELTMISNHQIIQKNHQMTYKYIFNLQIKQKKNLAIFWIPNIERMKIN